MDDEFLLNMRVGHQPVCDDVESKAVDSSPEVRLDGSRYKSALAVARPLRNRLVNVCRQLGRTFQTEKKGRARARTMMTEIQAMRLAAACQRYYLVSLSYSSTVHFGSAHEIQNKIPHTILQVGYSSVNPFSTSATHRAQHTGSKVATAVSFYP